MTHDCVVFVVLHKCILYLDPSVTIIMLYIISVVTLVLSYQLCIIILQMYLHDTGGGERFRTLTANFFRHAHAVILIYSVEDAFTFDNLTLWVEECHNSLGPEFESLVWVLVGNKADQPRAETITDERVTDFCKQLHAKYSYETSAKTGENVEQMFQTVAKVVHAAHGNSKAAKPKPTTTKLTSATAQTKKSNCDC